MKIVFVETITHEVDTDDYRRSLRATSIDPPSDEEITAGFWNGNFAVALVATHGRVKSCEVRAYRRRRGGKLEELR